MSNSWWGESPSKGNITNLRNYFLGNGGDGGSKEKTYREVKMVAPSQNQAVD